MKKLDLSEIRDRIDKIDSSLVELLEERMKIVEDVARYKKENNMKIFDPKREEEVIQKNTDRVKNNELKKYIEKILNDIMSVSKEYQESKLYEINEKKKTIWILSGKKWDIQEFPGLLHTKC